MSDVRKSTTLQHAVIGNIVIAQKQIQSFQWNSKTLKRFAYLLAGPDSKKETLALRPKMDHGLLGCVHGRIAPCPRTLAQAESPPCPIGEGAAMPPTSDG